MIITDTHTHLYSEEFDQDRDEMIQRAIKAGVSRFFIPAIDSQTTEAMYALEANYPDAIFLMAGLHPTYVKEDYQVQLAHVEKQLSERKFYAVGEKYQINQVLFVLQEFQKPRQMPLYNE